MFLRNNSKGCESVFSQPKYKEDFNGTEQHNNPKFTGGKQQQYPAIDILKFICAILVVSIHISPFSSYNSMLAKYATFGLQQYVARIAVPFYFTCAGFFLFRKTDLNNYDSSIAISYVKKILLLYGIWIVLLFYGSTGQLWYLEGLAVAVVFISILLSKKVSLRTIGIVTGILYIIGLLGDSYYGILTLMRGSILIDYICKVYEHFFGITRNGIFMGGIFVFIGALFGYNKIKLTLKTSIIGFAICIITYFAEIFIIKQNNIPRDYNMAISLVPLTIFIFGIASNIRLNNRNIYKKLRMSGMFIYYTHLFIYQFIVLAFGIVKKITGTDIYNSLIVFFLTVLISALLGFLCEYLSRKKKLEHIKMLFG